MEIPKRRRARELGINIGFHTPGANNSITDVRGVRVGHSTINFGEGALVPGYGPARTGVTVILPHDGDLWNERLSAASFVLNGNGTATGLDWMAESGLLEGPVFLTNTLSVGAVYDAAITWMLHSIPEIGVTADTYLPVIAECDDSALNDSRGGHVKAEHVFAAISSARSGPTEEGAVGAGTGMTSYNYKGGIGTSSRIVMSEAGDFTVGVLVNCNHGKRNQLLIDGVPVGRQLMEDMSTLHREGSICIVVATDAPLSPLGLNRLAKRAALGLARTGALANNGSGDFIIAFSTTRKVDRRDSSAILLLPELSPTFINPLFEACAESVEEAVVNTLFMAQTTVGRDGNVAYELPIDKTLALLKQYGR